MSESFWDKERPPIQKKVYMTNQPFRKETLDAIASTGWEIFLARSGEGAFEHNIKGLHDCEVVIANIDKPTPDAAWAVGFAVAINKTVLGLGKCKDKDNMFSHSSYIAEDITVLTDILSKL